MVREELDFHTRMVASSLEQDLHCGCLQREEQLSFLPALFLLT